MKTKEDILDELTEGRKGLFNDDVQVSFDDSIKAMQEYADQQTEQLKKQLEEKEKEAEKWKKAWGESEFICSINFKMHEKQVIDLQSQLSEKDKELSELKAKHEKDVKKAWQKGSESWIRGAQTAEQYYTQTHGQ